MVSVRWAAPILLFVVALPVFGAKKSTSSHPPRELHRVGDHMTAYYPPDPATYPAGSKTYTIKKGDTLWNLAEQFYKNAYLWPQLWEANTWITDAHWIYPGDVLLVETEVGQRAAAETTAAGTTTVTQGRATTTAQGATAATRTGNATANPVPLGSEADVYCFGYLGDPHEPMPNTIASFEDAETKYQAGAVTQSMGGVEGELVFIDGGTATGINPGETYLVVEPEDMIEHPVTHAIIGQHYDFRGQVRILRADDHRACGVIVQNCAEIHPGNRLKPIPQLPIPLARIPEIPGFCDDRSNQRQGFIVNAQGGWDKVLGEGILVEVNIGRDAQLQPGDFLTVFRPSSNPRNPPQILGEIGVLTTEAHSATGRIVAMRYSMEVGDRVEAR